MSRTLNDQELHNLAMNVVGKELQHKGFEFIAVNSQLKKHPQFVCVDKKNQRFFVIVKAVSISDTPMGFDVIWMETFKKHARSQKAKVIYAPVGIGNIKNKDERPRIGEDYLQQYEGLQFLDIELN